MSVKRNSTKIISIKSEAGEVDKLGWIINDNNECRAKNLGSLDEESRFSQGKPTSDDTCKWAQQRPEEGTAGSSEGTSSSPDTVVYW